MFFEWKLDENIEKYAKYYQKAKFRNIYHSPNYLMAEEMAEKYNTYIYVYILEEQYVMLPSIKRTINDISIFSEIKEVYYDLVTPHEYSGVVATEYNIELFKEFYKELEKFCCSNNIIFQFIRFNPYSNEHTAAFNFEIKLSDSQNWIKCDADILSQFQKRKARYVKSAINNGIILIDTQKNDKDVQDFFVLYQEAMACLNARKFMFFNYEYFYKLCQNEWVKLLFVSALNDDTKMAGIIMLCDNENKRIYHHLSFRNRAVNSEHTMEFMIYATAQWARENNYQYMHLGGGDKSLHQFKDGCTKERVDYYIGSKIYNPQVYETLCNIFCLTNSEMADSLFLPLYRSKE